MIDEKFINDSKVFNDIFKDNNIGIFTSRKMGKTTLSSTILLRYMNSVITNSVIILSREPISHYYDLGTTQNCKNSIDFIRKIQGDKYDLVFIDEIYQWGFTEHELISIFNILNINKTKILINGTPSSYNHQEYFNKINKIIDMFIINDNILNNLHEYIKGIKIKKIVNRINEKRVSFCI